MITVHKFIVNPLQENSLLVSDETGECVFVDAGFSSKAERAEVAAFVERMGLMPVMLVNTHCHFDHLWGVEHLRHTWSIPFVHHRADARLLQQAPLQAAFFGFSPTIVKAADRYLEDGGEILFGHSALQVLHVPGHSPGHIALYAPEDGFLIGGDLLFAGSIGRSDLPGGDYHQLISSITTRLLVLPPETKVWCGHGPETTLGYEKENNPFLTGVAP